MRGGKLISGVGMYALARADLYRSEILDDHALVVANGLIRPHLSMAELPPGMNNAH